MKNPLSNVRNFVFAGTVALASSSLSAATFLMDFNTASGSAGASWNVYAAHTELTTATPTIKDTTGSSSAGITIGASTSMADSTGSGLYNDNGPAWVETDSNGDNAADDFFWTGNGDGSAVSESFTVTFSGLTQGNTVSLDLFASRSSANPITAFYEYSLDAGATWAGFFVLESSGAAATSNGWGGNTTQSQQFNLDETGGYELGRYMNSGDLTVGALGTLDVRLTKPTGSNYAGINAVQLTVVPEPSSVALLGLGGLGLLVRRRR